MPRISDPSKYKKTSQDKEIERLEKEVKKEEEARKASDGKIKKEPKWSVLYVIIAIAVFGLGLLVICLMNLGIHGYFGL
ncbi:MAG: hypothetical protein K6B65_04835 [Bacilli bacterium]|nr:hypothetical protein [Bacilli bacterium]